MKAMHPEHCSDDSVQASESAHVNIVRIDLGGVTLIVVVLLVAIIGACGVVMGLDIAERSQMEREFAKLDRQYRMTELKLDDWTVVAHRSGLVLPGDYTRGPQGNLDSESFKDNGAGSGAGQGKKPTRNSQDSNGH
jgi:hypothetical protein